MNSEIEPTRKVIEGEVITKKTPEQTGRELGGALANLSKGLKAIGEGFKQASGKSPIVIEGTVYHASNGLYEIAVGQGERDLSTVFRSLENQRVRVIIEVVEDGRG